MPSPFFSRYVIEWLAAQTMTRAQQMVVDEVKSRVESGDLGDYEGVLFKDSFKGSSTKNRIVAAGVDLGVVVATKREIVGLLDKMGTPSSSKGNSFKYYYGAWKGRGVAIVQTGEGLDAARRGTEALLQAFHPARVASIGFACSVSPTLKSLSLLAPDRLVAADGSIVDLRKLAISAEKADPADPLRESPSTPTDNLPQTIPSPDAETSSDVSESGNKTIPNPFLEFTASFHSGALLSLDAEKPTASQRDGIVAYDRSTLAVAEVCVQAGAPFMPLRIIYDVASQQTSREAANVVRNNQTFARSLGALVGATLKKPSSLVDVCKIKEEELKAADILADAICRILAAVVPAKR